MPIATESPAKKSATTGAPYYLVYYPPDFPDGDAARAHFDEHWKERLEEDLALTFDAEQLSKLRPEDVITGGGAVFMFDQWRLVRKMEVHDISAYQPGDESPLGEKSLVKCPKCGRTAFREGHPLDFKSALYIHWIRLDNGQGKATKACTVKANEKDSPLTTARYNCTLESGYGTSTECLYDKASRTAFNILLSRDAKEHIEGAETVDEYITISPRTKLRRTDGVTFDYS
jgi:hypothetical protein